MRLIIMLFWLLLHPFLLISSYNSYIDLISVNILASPSTLFSDTTSIYLSILVFTIVYSLENDKLQKGH